MKQIIKINQMSLVIGNISSSETFFLRTEQLATPPRPSVSLQTPEPRAAFFVPSRQSYNSRLFPRHLEMQRYSLSFHMQDVG